MTPVQLSEWVREELSARVDPVFKEGASLFFKHEVHLHGVRNAQLKPIEQMVVKTLKGWTRTQQLVFCEDLWRSTTLEEGVIVLHSMRAFRKSFGEDDFRVFERWLGEYVHNWAHCDGLSTWLLAGCISNVPELKRKLEPWQTSRNRWKRRSAAVSLIPEAKQGRSLHEISATAVALSGDKDDMVQKGVGWLLKETYPKNSELVVGLLEEHRFPRLVVRYAAEKMSAQDKARFGLGLKSMGRSMA
ncbi:MAG TPA: DNA alkylation repair protein [Bryobacteraceae bacterium]|nr:DNA alkylation repair protein [Bryobacteraceae bacterium]